ncbi:leucine-rich repeat-containing protein 42-like isoform X2 [Apostichopus japonicus]|uniref:leucine-rich repeat-containing protein 42-like isoform X2 n=1 Tax=Stichopus japonicus TaxID=307972 RepID=UPI003AB404A7
MTAIKCCEAVADQEKYYQPTSLLILATEFVACHVINVESFTTIPEIIGKSIFEAALKLKQFGDQYSASCLESFTLAYKQLVLQNLTLKNNAILTLNRHIQEVKVFKNLKELDLSGCGIDDYHEILVHIGTQLHQLEVLLLADNELSDVGVQRLTAYSRVMKEGLRRLSYLDLSGNHRVTNKIFLYLKPFQCLMTLNVTGCSVMEARKESIYSQLGFIAHSSLPQAAVAVVENKGWAAPLIEEWKRDACINRLPLSGSSSAAKFYSKKVGTTSMLMSDQNIKTPLLFIKPGGCRTAGSTSHVEPYFIPVNISKNPSEGNINRGSLSSIGSPTKFLPRNITHSLLREDSGNHNRSENNEKLLATYGGSESEIHVTNSSDSSRNTKSSNDVGRKDKLVRNQKRPWHNTGKTKRKRIKLVDREGELWTEEPGCVTLEGLTNSEVKARDHVRTEERKQSVFDYLE